ncbi:MAG: bifunctional nicotinamidase/pyrazinamidase [Pseudomonadota bacterium]
MATQFTPGEKDVLIIVDVQNDFCPGGALAIEEGDQVVPVINRLSGLFTHSVLTQDWHPPGHSSFASSHAGKAPFEQIEVSYGPQTLWPDHCIIGTEGAAFRTDLETDGAELVIRKGFRPAIDSYSAFFENDKTTPTGLQSYLKERGFERAFVTGLALDFCVRFSAEDARACGLETMVVTDASRPVNMPGTLDDAMTSFADRGIACIDSSAIG